MAKPEGDLLEPTFTRLLSDSFGAILAKGVPLEANDVFPQLKCFNEPFYCGR